MDMSLLLTDMVVLAEGNSWLTTLIITFLAVLVAEHFIPNIQVEGFSTAAWVAVGLAILNATLVPVLNFFTAPLSWITLGLFQFLVSAIAILVVENYVKGFKVGGLINAVIMAVLVSIASRVIDWVI